MKYLLSLGLVLLTSSIFAQKTASNFPIFLKHETVLPAQAETQAPAIYGQDIYLIVQHPKLTLQADFHGFETFEYLPTHSAFARVAQSDFNAAKARLEAAGGRLLHLKPEWKLSDRLTRADYPEWAWLEGKEMKIWLRFWPQLDPQKVEAELQAAGLRIIDQNLSEDLFAVAHNPEQLDQLMALPQIVYIQEMEDPGEPENFVARTNVRVNTLQSLTGNGLNYDGTGVMIAHNDAGWLGPHIDFIGRLVQVQNGPAGSDHGDHTAGTIFGAGNMDPQGIGMAPGADMFYNTYPNNLNTADLIYQNRNARLTSNSFSNGCNAGYTNFTRQLDQDAFDNPNMLHVFSAGNNGTSDCGYGAGNGWGNITGGHKIAKNVITVGNVNHTDGLATSSSRGPTTDGRIKPDLVAVGTQVFSTTDIPRNNSYDRKTGTSMSCPGVTGSLAVLMQAFKDHYNQEPHGSLLRGILLNGCDDLGNPGPDFRYGFGRMNVNRSYQILADSAFHSGTLTNGDSMSFTLNVPANTPEMRVMLVWPDLPASTSASKALVNDLDLKLDDGSNVYLPWTLDNTATVAALNNNAVRGNDRDNNVEQITVSNPSAGNVTLTVTGHNIPSGSQDFYLVYYFEKDDLVITYPQERQALATGTSQLLRWDAPQSTAGFNAEFSFDGGNAWLPINTSPASSRTLTWVVPNIASDQVYLRIFNANDTDVVGPMTIVQVPALLSIDAACPDSVELSWRATPNASGYVLYRLGQKYMDSVAYVKDTTHARLAHDPLVEDFYAIAAVVNDSSIGYRSVAVEKRPGVFNCVVPRDLTLTEVPFPGYGEIPSCGLNGAQPVQVIVKNSGQQTISNFDVSFRRTGSGVTTETVNATLQPGDTMRYVFQATTALLPNVTLSYDFWVSAAGDGNPFNDTISTVVREVTSNQGSWPLPYSEDFESFGICRDDADCGFTNCNLGNGWINARNFNLDDIDWRTFAGSTFSQNTGPTRDHNPGTASGQYLYLEASGNCDSALAILTSPCIDLDSTFNPEAEIFYHMLGPGQMGNLSVDVFDGQRWYLDVVPSLKGNQSSTWESLKIDLRDFEGRVVNLRFRGKTGEGFRSDMALDDFSVYNTSGLGQDEWAQDLRIFPNPAQDILQIENTGGWSGSSSIVLEDLQGRRVLQQLVKDQSQAIVRLSLTDLPAGVYLLRIESESGRYSQRLIVE